jgi:purine-binding chemotaxis protein CheW
MPEILEFDLNGNSYAVDISYTREIVESLPITPIPGTQEHIAGMTNIRGEITTLISLAMIIGQKAVPVSPSHKFIILVSEAARGDKIGFIVDEVRSVYSVPDSCIEYKTDSSSGSRKSFIKGIIRLDEEKTGLGERKSAHKLILYLDMEKVLSHIFELAKR